VLTVVKSLFITFLIYPILSTRLIHLRDGDVNNIVLDYILPESHELRIYSFQWDVPDPKERLVFRRRVYKEIDLVQLEHDRFIIIEVIEVKRIFNE